MTKLVECVPNFSEGRDMSKIEAITREISSTEGVTLLDVDPGKDTNRTVVTFVGSPDAALEAAFKAIAKASLYVTTNFLSYDGYVAHGWFDAFMGRYEGRRPVDFIEQANAYEAFLLFCSAYPIFDGIISFMYHWDDPFGPELFPGVLVYADLMGSIRNKPAEAVFIRWSGGNESLIHIDGCEKHSVVREFE